MITIKNEFEYLSKNDLIDKNGVYVAYLRKSRADLELESIKKFDTLKAHEQLINKRIKELKLKDVKFYKEMVSGDSIQSRPEIQKLLKEVEKNLIDGVLVIDIDRLSRGDTKDQGIISQTFKYTNTKIITLNKIYDPNNDDDEVFFEFNLFMSRQEYRIINKRMQRGKLNNIMNGKYCAGKPPYGYNIVKLVNTRGKKLEPNEKTAPIVKKIFELKASGKKNHEICDWLESNNIKTSEGNSWTNCTLSRLLKNKVYTGKICWFKSKYLKQIKDGKITKKFKRLEGETFDGLHDAIIDEELFEKANSVVNPARNIKKDYELKNPLASLVKCKKCGKTLILKMKKQHYKKYNKTIIKRVYPVNKEKVYEILHNSFQNTKLTKSEIARKMGVPRSNIDNWTGNNKKYFKIPNADNWLKLKEVLNIQDHSCDKEMETIINAPASVPPSMLACINRYCNNKNSHLDDIEHYIVEDAKDYLTKKMNFLENYNNTKEKKSDIQLMEKNIQKEILIQQKKLNKAYELVELEIYSPLEYKERAYVIKNKIEELKKKIENINEQKNKFEIDKIPKYKELMDSYYEIENIQEKNDLLKSFISHIDYDRNDLSDTPQIEIHYKI